MDDTALRGERRLDERCDLPVTETARPQGERHTEEAGDGANWSVRHAPLEPSRAAERNTKKTGAPARPTDASSRPFPRRPPAGLAPLRRPIPRTAGRAVPRC